jgi:hypothetical protein
VHLLSLLGRIQETTVYNTLPEVTSWDTTFSAAESRQPFERLCRRERANFTVTGVPDFLSPSRLRSLTVQVLDAAGHPVRGYFRLSQDRGLAFALSGGAKYDLDGASWLFRTDVSGRSPKSDARFGFRDPACVWSLQAMDLAVAAADAQSLPVEALVFEFDLETVSAETPDSETIPVPPEQNMGMPEWQEAQLNAVALAGLSNAVEA